MHTRTSTRLRLQGQLGALVSWANTPDRSSRTEPARLNSPGSIEYHLRALDPETFAEASEEQKLLAATAARKAYFTELALKSLKARQGDAHQSVNAAEGGESC